MIVKAKPEDPIWCKYVLRPAGSPFVLIAARMGVTPNQVSVAGTLLTCIAAIALATGDLVVAICAALIFNMIALLDCVDGALARHTANTGPTGSWFDAQTGYTVYALLPLAVAWRAAGMADDAAGTPLLMAGALTAVMNLYSRILYQKYLLTAQGLGLDVSATSSSHKQSLKNRLLGELGFVGFMMPGLLVCVALGAEAAYVLFYFLVYVSVGVVGALVLMKRVAHLTFERSD